MGSYWSSRGDMSRLAEAAGCSASQLSDLLHRRKRCGGQLALRLRDATRRLGAEIPLETWLENTVTAHRAFFGQPQGE